MTTGLEGSRPKNQREDGEGYVVNDLWWARKVGQLIGVVIILAILGCCAFFYWPKK
jgi:hypothetical protein